MTNDLSSVRSRILLSIVADEHSMATLVNASQQTWIPLWPYHIVYFIIDNQSKKISSFASSQWNIVRLQTTDETYVNVHMAFDTWSYLYNRYANNYDYFLLIDSATYVNVKNILSMIESMTCTDCYIGRPIQNSGNDQPALVCSYMGYVIARNTLLKFGPYIEQCRSSISSQLEGREIGRCIHRYASGVSCTEAKPCFDRTTKTVEQERMHSIKEGAKSQVDFPKAPPTYLFNASLVYPLRKAESFLQFHRQVVQQLRPVLKSAFLNGSCVANPLVQNEMRSRAYHVPECRLSIPKITIDTKDRKHFGAFVLTLPEMINRAHQVIQLFQQHNVQAKVFLGTSGVKVPMGVALSLGEWNLRLSMTRLLQKVNASDYEHVLVLEDDAVPHRQFAQLFAQVIADQRCSEAASHGILLLGATIWNGAWKKLDKNNATEQGLCKNICYEAFGSFAVLLHRSTFEPILAWLNDNSKAQPYDLMFLHLASLGYPTRIAVPNLAITDVRHDSLIRPQGENSYLYDLHERARIHRWKLEDYMISLNTTK